RTGTCVRVMSRRMAKALRDLDDLAIQLLLVRLPAGAVPDLDVVEVAHDDDVLLDPGVVEQRRTEGHPAGRVEIDVPGVARAVAHFGPPCNTYAHFFRPMTMKEGARRPRSRSRTGFAGGWRSGRRPHVLRSFRCTTRLCTGDFAHGWGLQAALQERPADAGGA